MCNMLRTSAKDPSDLRVQACLHHYFLTTQSEYFSLFCYPLHAEYLTLLQYLQLHALYTQPLLPHDQISVLCKPSAVCLQGEQRGDIRVKFQQGSMGRSV